MPYTCPQCRAVYPTYETCEDRFNASQVTELEQAGYYAVHHFSVPCYMLQHNGYSRRGWLEVYKLLAEFVAGLHPDEALARVRSEAGSNKRTWNFTKGEKLAGVEGVAWTRTIADVRLDSAEHYCADVRAWAASIIADAEALVRASGGA
jgi:hypothetical protein